MNVRNEIAELQTAIKAVTLDDAARRAELASSQYKELLEWIHHLVHSNDGEHAPELLRGARAAMLESVAYLSLGFGRASVSSIRLVIDLTLGYLYFSTHPAEWDRVVRTGQGFMLRADIDKYCRSMSDVFGPRITVLDQQAGTALVDVYKILSAHVHGQSSLTIPKAGRFVELLNSSVFLDSVLVLQRQVVVALSNYLIVACARDILDLPPSSLLRVKQLQPKQFDVLFPT